MAERGISLTNGRLLDPASGLDQVTDLHLKKGRILAIGRSPEGFTPGRVIDVSGLIVSPGLVDLCARLREPGLEHKGTIASETRAAAAGGITTLCCPPDTSPVIDTPAVAQLIRRRAKRQGCARVLPVGALTQGLEGQQISEMAALKDAGCPVVGHADRPIRNTRVQRRALEYAATFGLTSFLHPADHDLSAGGLAHEGRVSTQLGLPAIPEAAETVAVARDLALAEQTGARVHFRGLSTARAAEMLAEAQQRGVAASADVSVHQLFLTEDDLYGFNADAHVVPPLRTKRDRDALRTAVASGAISAICSDHRPHEPDAKLAPFPQTRPGISALETLLSLVLELVEDGVMDLRTALARVTCHPADILSRELGRLSVGAHADLCIFDPATRWQPEPETWVSRGQNTPFFHRDMQGRVRYTISDGRVVYEPSGETRSRQSR